MFVVKRTADNPILIPNKDHYFEEFATFNMCPVVKGKNVYGLYRAISASDSMRTPHQSSVIGIAESHDGIHFKNQKPFIIPEKEWEQFGCEDPRVTYFEGKYYIFYTAISKYPMGPEGIKVAVIFSAHTDSPPAKMSFAYLDKIEDLWSPVFWEKWSEHINENLIDPR